MFNDELVIGLKEVIETKSLGDIDNFISILYKSNSVFGNTELDSEYEIEDVKNYLKLIERYFQNKEEFEVGSTPSEDKNPYEIFRPCYDVMKNSQEFYDIMAEKIEEFDYTDNTRLELVSALNTFMGFCEIPNEFLYNEEELEAYTENQSELCYNLKEALYSKISELNMEDFLKLDIAHMDSFYDDIINERIEQMNEIEFYKFMQKVNIQSGYKEEEINKKLKELNSPALYNLYSSLSFRNYNEKGDKIGYLKQLRNKAIKNIEETITDGEEISGYGEPPQPLFIPKWSDEDYKRLEQTDEYKLFIEKISTLNNQEFVMYLISAIPSISEIKINNENNLIEKKIKELSDTDLEAVYYLLQQDYNQYPAVTDEIKNRRLLVEKVETIENEELKNKDLVEKRAKKYKEIMNFNFDVSVTKPLPLFCSEKAITEFQNIENNLIKTICKMEKYNDIQCMQIINQLNQTENASDYECVDFEYNKYDWDKDDYIYKDMPEDEKIHIYKQKCKYQLIKYLSKRLLSMPKGYLAMANISNENGIFNEVIEIGLENTEIHIEPEKDDENYI